LPFFRRWCEWEADAAFEAEALPVAENRDRLRFKFFRVMEGEATGRFAITVFALLVFAILVSAVLVGRPFAYRLGGAVVNGAEAVSALAGVHP
jgi:hypothetical protein